MFNLSDRATMLKKITWDRLAPVYPVIRNNPLSGLFLNQEIKALRKLLAGLVDLASFAVIDLGIGRGHSTILVKNKCRRLLGLDRSSAMLRALHTVNPEIPLIRADAICLPFKANSFDLVLCVGLLEYIPDINTLISQIAPLIKPQKYLLITNSPPGLLTRLRQWNGQPIYARQDIQIEQTLAGFQLQLLEKAKTGMQSQFLYQMNR